MIALRMEMCSSASAALGSRCAASSSNSCGTSRRKIGSPVRITCAVRSNSSSIRTVRERSCTASAQRLRSGSWWATTSCSISPVSSTSMEIEHQSASSGTASSVRRSSVRSSSSDEVSSAVASPRKASRSRSVCSPAENWARSSASAACRPSAILSARRVGRELLVGREGEDEPADRASFTHQRHAHEPVPRLRAADQLRVALVPLRLGADEDALAGPHRLRERKVPADGEAPERLDEPQVVAARGDHVEPLAVVAQRRDQPAASLRCAHAFGEHGIEDFLRRVGGGEGVRDVLQPRRRVERALALPHGALCSLACRPLAPEHLAAEQRRHDEHDERGRALGVDLVAVVAVGEEVEEREHGRGDRDEAADPAADEGGKDDRDHVQQARNDGADAREGEQRDERRRAERDRHGLAPVHRELRPPSRVRVLLRRCVGDHSCSESSRLSCSRSPLATRSSTSRTTPASSTGSNGLTT